MLHDPVKHTSKAVLMVSSSTTKICLDCPNHSQKVILKLAKVLIHSGSKAIEIYAILDDGSERTISLMPVVQHLKLSGIPETLLL